jgi:LacI family transcriptional regulator
MPASRRSKPSRTAPPTKPPPEPPSDRRPTSRTVAAAAGVSVFTVSQAIAGRPGVAPATRARVLEVAARLGYQPDPAAARLVARRRHRTPHSSRLVVAALASSGQSNLSRLKTHLDAYAASLALDLRVHLLTFESSPAATLRALWQQGVQGLALCPALEMTAPGWREADWSRFSVFKSTRSMPNLPFDLVRHDAWDYLSTTLATVIARGYRRLAVLLHRSASEPDNLARLGAVLVAQERLLPAGARCEWREYTALFDDSDAITGIGAWLRAYRPDAVVVPYRSTFEKLLQVGFRPPHDFAVACVLSGVEPALGTTQRVSGCDTRERELYEVSLYQVRERILNGDRGLPAHPSEHVLDPRWLEGDTLPNRAPGA